MLLTQLSAQRNVFSSHPSRASNYSVLLGWFFPIPPIHRHWDWLLLAGHGRSLLAVSLVVEVREESDEREGIEDECPLVGDRNAAVEECRSRYVPQDQQKLDLKAHFIV